MKTTLASGLFALSALSMTGCLEVALVQALDRDEDEDDAPFAGEDVRDDAVAPDAFVDEYDYEYEQVQALDVREATLSGDMGSVRGIDDSEPMVSSYDQGDYASLEVHATASSGAAMAILTIEGGLDHPSLRPGAHLEFSDETYDVDGLHVGLLGCSGPQDGNWEFDQYAPQVTVDVRESPEPGLLALEYSATFSDGGTVEGSAELGPLQAQ